MDERKEAIEAILKLPAQSRILLLGGTDTGKSTFGAEAVNAMILRDHLPIAVIDADTGQSAIGPPAVVSLGYIGRDPRPIPIRALSQVPFVAGGFVGAVTPAGFGLEISSAAMQMLSLASLLNPKPAHILIDTPGYVTGYGAAMFRSLIAMIHPSLVLAFARHDELEPIIRPLVMLSLPNTQVLGVPVSEKVIRKTSSMRATKRAARFAERFHNASSVILQWDQVAFENTALTYGEPQLPHLLQYIGMALGGECVYAERKSDGVMTAVMADSPPPTKLGNTAALEQHFKINKLIVTSVGRFTDLLCGLHGQKGELLEIAIIRHVDFVRRRIELLTRLKHPGAVAKLTLGYVRCKSDGREIGHLTQGQAA